MGDRNDHTPEALAQAVAPDAQTEPPRDCESLRCNNAGLPVPRMKCR
jgi:hypothetical protein